LYCLENDVYTFVCLWPIKAAGEQSMYHNCSSLCSLCKGKEGEKAFTYQLFHEIQELKPIFWFLIFFNLINKLELVSGECEFGTLKLNYFIWTKIDISVLKFLILQQLLQFLRALFFIFSITEPSIGPLTGFTFDKGNDL
jgi:hypothetical protein